MKRVLILAAVSLGCGKTDAPAGDAGVEHPARDVSQRSSDLPAALTVDFAVEGCPSFDPDTFTCTGPAPLSLRFVPMATTTVNGYIWDLGGVIDTGPTPLHTYTEPGKYTVKLLASGLDSILVNKSHIAMVVVTANEIGGVCTSDTQCATKLSCLCPTDTSCEFGPPHGVCVSYCSSSSCGEDQVCAGLAAAGTHEPWQASLCLRRCTDDTDCSGRLRCRLLPPGSVGTTWVRGCFGDLPADAGRSCIDSTNHLRDELCATGICAELGAKGMCTMACSTQNCPAGTDCAILGDGRKLCLRPCDEGFTCSADPLLGCVPPADGDLGYRLVSTSVLTPPTYCAPKPCTSDQQCAPTGRCDSSDDNGHCVARSD